MQDMVRVLREFLGELTAADGTAAVNRFGSEQALDVRISEFRVLLSTLSPDAAHLVERFDEDRRLRTGSMQQRLTTLIAYCTSTMKLLERDVIHHRGAVVPPPTFSRLARAVPGLPEVLAERWIETQGCINTGSYNAAVILMGSILEASLLSFASIRETEVRRSRSLPKNVLGRPLQEWTLSELIVAALELRWISAAPSDFPAALRKFRELLHPWAHASARAQLDLPTCESCWRVLNVSIEGLLSHPA